jgi:hypothetical protein
MEFVRILADGSPDRPRAGDRLIYNRKSGTLSIYRDSAELRFATDTAPEPREHVFVGLNWGTNLTKATAELYARLGEMDGHVVRIEGSFPTLETWEIVS